MENHLTIAKRAICYFIICNLIGLLLFECTKTGEGYEQLEEQQVAMTDVPEGIGETAELTEESMESELSKYETEESAPSTDDLIAISETGESSSDENAQNAGGESVASEELSEPVEPQADSIYEDRVADFHAKWKRGNYSYTTGKYESYHKDRVSHVSYDAVTGGATYQILVSNADFQMLVRELDSSYGFITTSDLSGGSQLTLSENTAYVGITLYAPKLKKLTFADYETLFGNGMTAEFVKISGPETAESENETEGGIEESQDEDAKTEADIDIETDTEIKDVSKEETAEKQETEEAEKDAVEDELIENDLLQEEPKQEEMTREERLALFEATWKRGTYSYVTGKYESYHKDRICHKNYDEVIGGATYQVVLSNSNYHMLVRELDQNLNFIKTSDLAGGQEITLTNETAYVGIGLYAPKLKGITMDTYRELFSHGMAASFELLQKDVSEEASQGSFEDILIGLLESAELTSVNVFNLNIRDTDALQSFDNLMREKYYLLYKCVPDLSLSMTCDQNGNVKTVSLGNLSADNMGKYKKMQKAVNQALAGLKEGMSETEKALLLHDYLMELVSYEYHESNPGYQAYDALVGGNAICHGYADALVILYHEAGLESVLVDGNGEHHAWVLVRLDGSYYHIDPTWNDLQSNYKHFYFLRSDAQFANPDKGDAHFSWTSEGNHIASSNRFDSWFIHDVVGNVVYENGYWYYAAGNTLKRAKIDGSSMEVVATEKDMITAVTSTASGVKYTVGSEIKYYK